MGPYKGRPRAEFGGRHRKGLDSFAEKKMGVICAGVWGREERGKAREDGKRENPRKCQGSWWGRQPASSGKPVGGGSSLSNLNLKGQAPHGACRRRSRKRKPEVQISSASQSLLF